MKFFILLSLLLSTKVIFADSVFRVPVLDYQRTEYEQMFEIKTFEFPKVILDCQSFFHEIRFFQKTDDHLKIDYKLILSAEDCYRAHVFLFEANESKRPACLEINRSKRTLTMKNKSKDCK